MTTIRPGTTADRPYRADEVFFTAVGYYIAARRAYENVSVGPHTHQSLPNPCAMNASFSSELFIKSLLLLQSPTPARGHDLRKLYDRLPADDHKAAAALYSRYPGYSVDGDVDKTHDYFEVMRYYFEHIMTSTGFDPNAALRLADSLYRLAAAKHRKPVVYTEWGSGRDGPIRST